jgi:hypothetical protein
MHQHATGPNLQHLVVIDLAPEVMPDGTRRKPGDPKLPPQRIVMPYVLGAEACERDPQRYKPAELTADEHFALGRRDRSPSQ